jgi:integrase
MVSGLEQARKRRGETGPNAPNSNQNLYDGWKEYADTRLADISIKHYNEGIQIFLEYIGNVLATTLRREDFWLYIDDYLASPRTCTNYHANPFGRGGPTCAKGLDLVGCNTECPMRQQVAPVTIKSHLRAITSLYQYLTRRGHLESNVLKDVAQAWWQENRHSERAQPKRRFTAEEVETLIRKTRQPNRHIAWAILALTAVRCSELLRLTRSQDMLNLEEGWIKIPFVSRQKRQGESKLWLTDDLVCALREYLEWWERTVQRDDKGKPLSDHLLITARGTPWTSYYSLKEAWNLQCIRTGVLAGGETRFTTLTPHDLRHWLTTELVKAKAPDYYVALYRGDKRGIVADRYTHLTDDEKRKEFLRLAPRLNL